MSKIILFISNRETKYNRKNTVENAYNIRQINVVAQNLEYQKIGAKYLQIKKLDMYFRYDDLFISMVYNR